MLLSLSVVVAGVIGTISVGGVFLAGPVVIALLQTQIFRHLKQQG